MRENFLHYIWKYKKFDVRNLRTTQHESIHIVSVGIHNHNSGPDFFNAKLKIEHQLWAGNVEIHVKSSDWFVHHHEQDKTYDNVILHVVYEHDMDVFRKSGAIIPTLELKNYISRTVLENYKTLFANTSKWINCENDFPQVSDFIINNWFERLYIERLEHKAKLIKELLKTEKNDWEAVLFKMLAKSFGLKLNTDAFLSIANSVDFSLIKKIRSNLFHLESLLFGQAGLLEQDGEDKYYNDLKKEYHYLKHKYHLSNKHVTPLQFFRLRPHNFPTIRLSQLANVYFLHSNLFSKVIECNSVEDSYSLFKISTSSYWTTHYTFNNTTKPKTKQLSKAFIDLLMINTILPLQFSYAKHTGTDSNYKLFTMIKSISSESNTVIQRFNTLKKVALTALDSQALIQLKTMYCEQHQCLKCAIGNSLLSK